MARGKAKEKAFDKAKLKETNTIWIGVRATESNLQRLAAYLLFAERPLLIEEDVEKPIGPMPWDDPAAFEAMIPEESIDWGVVKVSTTKLLQQHLAKFGEEPTRSILVAHGAERLSLVPRDQLLPLNAALERALEKK